MPLILSLLLVMPAVAIAADAPLPARAQRALDQMAAEMAEAQARLAAAQLAHEEALAEARRDAVGDLQKQAEREREFATKALLFKYALAIEPESATAARAFFTAIGTLDQVLAEIEADNPVPTAQGDAIDLLAAGGGGSYDPLADPVPGAPLADIDPLRVAVGWAQLARGSQLPQGQGPMTVQGTALTKGLCAHPPSNGASEIVYAVPRGARELLGACAVDDQFQARTASALTFVIRGDGRELWRSPPIQPASQALVPFRVPLTGVSELTLQVECAGPFGAAMALWVNPTLR